MFKRLLSKLLQTDKKLFIFTSLSLNIKKYEILNTFDVNFENVLADQEDVKVSAHFEKLLVDLKTNKTLYQLTYSTFYVIYI